MRRWRDRIGLCLAVAVLSGCSGGEEVAGGLESGGGRRGAFGGSPELQAVSVKAYRARREPISTYLVANTSLEAIRSVTVYAKLNAIVEEILVEEGDRVQSGQVLLRLEDLEIRNEFDQARIAVDQARLASRQAEVRARQAQANFERARALHEQELISQEQFDQSELANRTDELAFESSREQLRASTARLEAARIQLNYTEIRSSIDGIVTERLVDRGSRVNVNQAVFALADVSTLWARIFIPEKSLSQLRVGQSANLRVDAFPGEEFDAFIKMISPTVDPTSGTVKVTLEVRGPRTQLRPGMFGSAYIATRTRPAALVIPKRAILRERDENRVFVIKPDNTVAKREVVLGFSEENRVEVMNGVDENAAVVTVGQEGLNEGYPVQVLEWENSDETVVATAPSPAAPQRVQPGSEPAPGPGAAESAASGRDRGGKGFDPRRMAAFRERLLADPEIRKQWEARLEEDPSLADDPEKQRAFFREVMRRARGNQGRQ